MTKERNYDGNILNFHYEANTVGNIQFITFYQVKDGSIMCLPKNAIMFYTNDILLSELTEHDDEGYVRLRQNANIKTIAY